MDGSGFPIRSNIGITAETLGRPCNIGPSPHQDTACKVGRKLRQHPPRDLPRRLLGVFAKSTWPGFCYCTESRVSWPTLPSRRRAGRSCHPRQVRGGPLCPTRLLRSQLRGLEEGSVQTPSNLLVVRRTSDLL